MAKFQLTNKAVSDLSNIWNYTFENWSEKQADNYYNSLLEACYKISRNPNIGRSYSKVLENLLGLKMNRHIIFYRIIGSNKIEITRILHGSMDLKKRIFD